MNAPLHNEADIRRALVAYVVSPQEGRPNLEITTPEGTFHLVTVEGDVLPFFNDAGELTFILFFGQPPIGRREVFMWPPEGVQTPAHAITGLQVYGT